MKSFRNLCLLALPALSPHLATSVLAQGSLTPPGAPAPMMKTLDQIEPRTPVNATATPGDATHLFIISQPGSYYLTGNINGVAAKHGILIAASDVRLDLNGFAMIGAAGSLSGIRAGDSTQRQRITIRNGTIAGWRSYGIVGSGLGNSYERLRIIGNGGSGAAVSYFEGGLYTLHGTVSSCLLSHNQGHGMEVSSHAIIVRTIASGNTSPVDFGEGSGFQLSSVNVISDCLANGNKAHGIWSLSGTVENCVTAGNDVGLGSGSKGLIYNVASYQNTGIGISSGENSTVRGCAVITNSSEAGISVYHGSRVESCTAVGGGDGAIATGDVCTVAHCLMGASASFAERPSNGLTGGDKNVITECSSAGNEDAGILAGSCSIITGCHVSLNGTGGAVAGIRITGTGSRIEGNKARDNTGTGILCAGGAGADTILNNVCGGNSTNYSPAGGATFGPLQTPASGLSSKANF